jgi:acetate---CoA ligase (ADP-forming)
MAMDLTRLLRPRSIAVVGANDRPGSYSGQAIINLDAIGFEGPVWGINPRRSEVLGRPCVPTLADLPEAVDAVVVAIPAVGVPEVIEQAGALGCGGAVVFSAGFREIAEGAGLEAQLVAASKRHGLPICGPNGNGIVAMHARAAMWGDGFAPREPGAVAMISQSGNIAVNALATERGLRFHTVISGGNQSVLEAADYLAALAREDGLRSIAMYLEDDGGPRLCDGLAACAEAGVRVAVLKAGTSAAGQRTVAAHSGSLAGDQRVFRSMLQEAGAWVADDLHELLEVAKSFATVKPLPASRAPRPQGAEHGAAAIATESDRSPGEQGIAILTCSGGDSAQGADEASRRGLALPEFSDRTSERLRELLPPAATVANPLDYTAMIWGDVEALAEIIETVAADPAIGQVLVFYDQPRELDPEPERSWAAVREGIAAGAARIDVPVIVSSTLPELLDDTAAWEFASHGIAPVAGLRAGLACAEALQSSAGDPRRLREIAAVAAASASAGEPLWLSEHESKELLRSNGVRVPDGRLLTSEDDAIGAITELGAPLALKLSSASVQHKTELGAVELNLNSETQTLAAYRRLEALTATHGGAVLAERMAAPGVELLVAARADTIIPVVVIALGGIWTELLDDVVIVPLPAGADRIEEALRSLRGAPMFAGGRGRRSGDIAATVSLIERCGELLLSRGLGLIELNPVFVGEHGAIAVDATILTRAPVAAQTDTAALAQPLA